MFRKVSVVTLIVHARLQRSFRMTCFQKHLLLFIHPPARLPLYLHTYLPTYLPTYLSIYSCFSHLEHRASVKRFVSLQFFNLRYSVGLLGRGISPTLGHYLRKHRIETHDPSHQEGKTIHTLYLAANVTSIMYQVAVKLSLWLIKHYVWSDEV
jgi:hypothetical protein